jgi:hypothetical protein
MRSPISVKIPKRSESAFPNREYSALICVPAFLMRLHRNFRLLSNRWSNAVLRTGEGSGGTGN